MLKPGQPMSPAEIDAFLEWADTAVPQAEHRIAQDTFNARANALQAEGKTSVHASDLVREEFARILQNSGLVHLQPSQGMGQLDLDKAHCTFTDMLWSSGDVPPLTGNTIHRIVIDSAGESKTVRITECKIGTLSTGAFADRELVLKGCQIGKLHLSNTVRRLVIDDCMVGRITTDGANRFSDVVIRHLVLPLHRRGEDIQWIRTMRVRLAEKGIVLAAAVFHRAELILDREHDTGWNNFVSRLYEVGSNFGNSALRPILWFALFFLMITALAAGFDFVQLGGDAEWTRDLSGAAWDQRTKRGALLAIQSILNPLNLFSAKPLVSAKDADWAAITAVLGLLGTLSLGLFALALRRRFKLSGGSNPD